MKDSSVQVVETKYGDVGKEIQARLVEDLLQTHKDVDYLVGNALMVEAAVPILRARNLQNKVKLVSVYMSPGVYQGVKSKAIEASGSGQIVLAGRMMVDSAVRLLENKVEHRNVYTIGRVYNQDDIQKLDVNTVLAPGGFKPIFKFTP
ncbi:hypothetical protein [Aquabacterium sp.]|uniref:hypothetical protein n=1 Tax=Aquabacterium sp. TaxID=1872578 RepID=UPI0039B74BBA